MSLTLLILLSVLLGLFVTPSHSTTIFIGSNCPYTIWAAAVPGGGCRLDRGQVWTLDLPRDTSKAHIWGRTNCSFDARGQGHCQTGDSPGEGGGGVSSSAKDWAPPNTQVWYNLDQEHLQADLFHISLNDGFNIPIQIIPTELSARSGCFTLECTGDVEGRCPNELKAPGGCNNPCAVFKTDEYCCPTGKCSPTNYSEYLKNMCPDARTYLTHYMVVFCPRRYSCLLFPMEDVWKRELRRKGFWRSLKGEDITCMDDDAERIGEWRES